MRPMCPKHRCYLQIKFAVKFIHRELSIFMSFFVTALSKSCDSNDLGFSRQSYYIFVVK